jgi:recombinational DNA repair protein RecR
MKTYKMIDYKGKYFILQDEVDEESGMDIEIGQINTITDRFLEGHVAQCIYYGIPAYLGNDKELKERVKKLETEYSLRNY